MKWVFKILFCLIFIVVFQSCKNSKSSSENNTLIVFHAGSLSVPFTSIINEYKKENNNIEITTESAGSLAAARKITELKKDCDLLAVADYLVVDNLMIPDYASWNFVFASNEMVIVYNDNSKYCKEVNSQNLFDYLLKDDVVIARANPNADPCGYRSVFIFKLAEIFYKKEGLSDTLLNKKSTIIRPKEVDLIALLETGNVDYLMIYKSVALQHNLKFIELPDELNLSNPNMEDYYSTVSLSVDGANPGEKVEMKGSAILYSFCITKNSKNLTKAIDFVNFITDPEKGGKILKKEGMGVLNYSNPKYTNELPDELKKRL